MRRGTRCPVPYVKAAVRSERCTPRREQRETHGAHTPDLSHPRRPTPDIARSGARGRHGCADRRGTGARVTIPAGRCGAGKSVRGVAGTEERRSPARRAGLAQGTATHDRTGLRAAVGVRPPDHRAQCNRSARGRSGKVRAHTTRRQRRIPMGVDPRARVHTGHDAPPFDPIHRHALGRQSARRDDAGRSGRLIVRHATRPVQPIPARYGLASRTGQRLDPRHLRSARCRRRLGRARHVRVPTQRRRPRHLPADERRADAHAHGRPEGCCAARAAASRVGRHQDRRTTRRPRPIGCLPRQPPPSNLPLALGERPRRRSNGRSTPRRRRAAALPRRHHEHERAAHQRRDSRNCEPHTASAAGLRQLPDGLRPGRRNRPERPERSRAQKVRWEDHRSRPR